MHGTNPIRPPSHGDGMALEVQEVFPTIQGEGPFVGHPAVFIRLGGCNLACHFCDTEFESFSPWTLAEIMSAVRKHSDGCRLVVITGGEPLRQPIELLCEKLLEAGYEVQIETNGTLWRKLDPRVKVVCSPKNVGLGYHDVREDVLAQTVALKFIISEGDALYHKPAEVGQSKFDIPVYLQPMDEADDAKNAQNLAHAKTLCEQYGYVLGVQMHKLLGMP